MFQINYKLEITNNYFNKIIKVLLFVKNKTCKMSCAKAFYIFYIQVKQENLSALYVFIFTIEYIIVF